MARLFTCGFELNTLADGVELYRGGSQTGAIVTSPVRSGTYAYQNKPSASVQNLSFDIAGTSGLKTSYYRFYYRIATQPASNTLVWFASVDGATPCLRLRGTGSGLKVTNAADTQVGSNFALSTGQWYRIEIKLFSNASTGTVDVLVDGVSVVSATGVGTNGSDLAVCNFGSGGSVTHEYYIDDIAINDGTGSYQNTYPGAGKVIAIRPDSAGDNTQWTIVGIPVTNYGCVNEVTPDDATTYVSDGTLNDTDMYNCAASGIGASDTVNVVHVGVRYTNDTADNVLTMKMQIEKASGGTISQSGALIANRTAWGTNASAATSTSKYPITLYLDPDGAAWTQATLDTMQIGQKITAAGTHNLRVTTVWTMVDYTPSAGGNTLKTVNGLAATSIKTIQTLARASVKAYDGLTPP